MPKITKIEPVRHVKKKKKVSAYCRVSTAKEKQELSLEAQIAHYENYIRSNPDWIFAGVFFDDGISGTSKEKREGLQKLIKACEAVNIDLVLTKSISRFARNTTDCLEMVRRLSAIGVVIVFEKEGIRTDRMDSELLLSIMSSVAAAESESISGNKKWSIQRQFRNGTFVISTPPYGYKLHQKTMVVDTERRL